MKITEETMEKLRAAQSAEELIAMAREEGIELPEEQVTANMEALKNGELTDEEMERYVGGGWWNDFVNWIMGYPSFIDVSYNPVSGRYFCPHCNDGDHTISYISNIITSSGYYADVYNCYHCNSWLWHFTSGDRNGKWMYRPDQD